MEQIDLLLSATWVMPIQPKNQTLTNHAVAIDQGKIKAVLPLEQAKQQFTAKQQFHLTDHVLMPGLINAHAHTPMNLFKGLADDLDLMDWLENHIWPAEQAIINSDSVKTGTTLAIAEMLRGGITCFNDHYFYPNVIAKTAIECGMRACVGLVAMSVPTQWASSEDEYFTKAEQTLTHAPDHEFISWVIAPHAPYTVSDTGLKKVKVLSDQYNLPIHMHVHETAFEVSQSEKDYQKRPLQRLHDLKLLGPKFISVHTIHITDYEIKLLQQTGSHIVHCPESNLKLASGFAPVEKFLQAGINVAIGTDGAASNNDLDLFGEIQTAAITAKAVSGDPKALPAHRALEMATINGAKALGLEKTIGSLEAGKAADIIAIDLGSYLTQPVYHPSSQIVYAINRQQVQHVWVAGKQLLKNGKLTQIDTDALIQQVKTWQQRIEKLNKV